MEAGQAKMDFMEMSYLYLTYGAPILCFFAHTLIVIGKYWWRRKHGLRRNFFREFIVVAGFWLFLWGGASLYYSNRFFKYEMDIPKGMVVLSYFPSKKEVIPFDKLSVIRIVKPLPRALSVRKGWHLEVALESGENFRSLSARPKVFDTWPRDRITRKELVGLEHIFE